MAHKTCIRCVLFGLASRVAITAALARSIEGACGMSRTFSRSKHLNISHERAFGAYAANQEIDVATQHNI
jgi:glyoxylate carboligase